MSLLRVRASMKKKTKKSKEPLPKFFNVTLDESEVRRAQDLLDAVNARRSVLKQVPLTLDQYARHRVLHEYVLTASLDLDDGERSEYVVLRFSPKELTDLQAIHLDPFNERRAARGEEILDLEESVQWLVRDVLYVSGSPVFRDQYEQAQKVTLEAVDRERREAKDEVERLTQELMERDAIIRRLGGAP